jgi:hypothetical protein
MAETLMSQDFQCLILVATYKMWIAKTFNLCSFPAHFGALRAIASKVTLIFEG